MRYIGITGLPLKIFKHILDRWGPTSSPSSDLSVLILLWRMQSLNLSLRTKHAAMRSGLSLEWWMLCCHTATTASMTPPWRVWCPTWRARAWASSMPACSAWACSLNRCALAHVLDVLTQHPCSTCKPGIQTYHSYSTLVSIFVREHVAMKSK